MGMAGESQPYDAPIPEARAGNGVTRAAAARNRALLGNQTFVLDGDAPVVHWKRQRDAEYATTALYSCSCYKHSLNYSLICYDR